MTGSGDAPKILPHPLRMVAWEVTRSCNLSCRHCRASSERGPYRGELGTEACLALLDDIASVGRPVIILTGGEPLLRPDIFTLARYGDSLGLRMVLATNGTGVDGKTADRIRESGIRRVSVSLDGPDAASHDALRAVPGAFDGALRGIEALKKAGVEFQVNTTVTRENLADLERILDLAVSLGAAAHHLFLLVPTGRGKEMAEEEISAEDYEKTLLWFLEKEGRVPMELKATCAPHYFRIRRQHGKDRNRKGASPALAGHGGPTPRGCLGGITFCFISHTGQVQPCGYLEVDCGQVSQAPFPVIWEESPVFGKLRRLDLYGGKCGRCEFLKVCGGCRARAFEATGDYLAEEPLCVYEPRAESRRRP